MPIAYNLTCRDMHYRHDVFSAGLRAAGYEVRAQMPGAVNPGDVVLGWNRYGTTHEVAKRIEAAGATYLCAENGYLGVDENGHQLYALARGYHNDSTVVREGGPERFAALGVDLAPWRASGGHVLVCPNRSFGTPGNIMPPDWGNDVRRRLTRLTRREVRLRPHPGNDKPRKPLAEDLRDCWCVVIWSSSCGVAALVAGIPVICEAPKWICKGAADRHLECVEKVDDRGGLLTREEVLQRLAWAQFSLREIESGFAFASLLRPARETEVAASA